jgi:hypothetical protein
MSGGVPRTSAGFVYTSLSAWKAAVRGYVQHVAKFLKSHGIEVWANLSSTQSASTDTWSQDIALAVTGTTQEFFIARGNEPTATLENGHYTAAVAWLKWLNTNKLKYHMHAQSDNPQLVDYAAGTFALWADPDLGFFSAGRDPYPVSAQLNTPLMQALRRTGAPLSLVAGGQRRFVNGIVQVNASGGATSTQSPTSARWLEN